LRGFWRWLLVIVVVMVGLRLCVGQSFVVTGESMEPTLLRGDVVLVSTLGRYEAERGDVVVLRPEDMRTPFVKRVAALGGEAFEFEGKGWDVPEGRVFVLGDRREASLDSRVEARMGGTGMVPEDNLVGEVKLVLLSVADKGVWWKPWTWLRWGRWFVGVE